MRKATRFALGSSYMTGQPGHIPYEERLEKCNLVCSTERRRYLDLMIAIKIMKGEIQTKLLDRMNELSRLRHTTVRNPRVFDIPNNISVMSPLYRFLTIINNNPEKFEFDDNTEHIRSILKKEILRQWWYFEITGNENSGGFIIVWAVYTKFLFKFHVYILFVSVHALPIVM